MSNEMKDYLNDLRDTFNQKMDEVNLLYDGWLNTFVPIMMDELFDELGGYVEYFEVFQIKEKYGAMRFYWYWNDRDDYSESEIIDIYNLNAKIKEIVRKYETISENTCVVCGRPATKMTTGWVLPVCDEHEYL